jgi:hypothetical protein
MEIRRSMEFALTSKNLNDQGKQSIYRPKMSTSTIDLLAVNLSKIEAIVEELPRVGKRSELKVRTDEILKLTEMIRRQVYSLKVEQGNEQYTPDFKQYGGGTAGRKE